MGQGPTENNGTLRRDPWGELSAGEGGIFINLGGVKGNHYRVATPAPSPRLARALRSGEGRFLEPKRAVATGEG